MVAASRLFKIALSQICSKGLGDCVKKRTNTTAGSTIIEKKRKKQWRKKERPRCLCKFENFLTSIIFFVFSLCLELELGWIFFVKKRVNWVIFLNAQAHARVRVWAPRPNLCLHVPFFFLQYVYLQSEPVKSKFANQRLLAMTIWINILHFSSLVNFDFKGEIGFIEEALSAR